MKKKRNNLVISWFVVICIVFFLKAFFVEAFNIPTSSMKDTYLPGDFLLVNKFSYGLKIPLTLKNIIPGKIPKRGEIVVFRFPLDPDTPYMVSDYVRIIFPKYIPLLPLWWNKRTHTFFFYAPRSFIKRCVALEGDTVEIRNKKVYINGEIVEEPYVVSKDCKFIPGIVLPFMEYQRKWENGEFVNKERVRDNFGPVVVPEGCFFAMGDNRDFSYDSRYWGAVPYKNLKGSPLFIYFSIAERGNFSIRLIKSRWNRIGKIMK